MYLSLLTPPLCPQALREELLGTLTAMASTGLRTLCLAYTDFPEADPSRPADFFAKPHGLEQDLTMLCIVGIMVGGGGWGG
jgi:Ca2+-transporting ATPase